MSRSQDKICASHKKFVGRDFYP